MRFPRKRIPIRGFQKGSPEHVFLAGLRRIMRGKDPTAIRSGSANTIESFKHALSDLTRHKQASIESAVAFAASQEHSSGNVHIRINQLLEKEGYSRSHINAIPIETLEAMSGTGVQILNLLPRNKSEAFIVIAWSENGKADLLL